MHLMSFLVDRINRILRTHFIRIFSLFRFHITNAPQMLLILYVIRMYPGDIARIIQSVLKVVYYMHILRELHTYYTRITFSQSVRISVVSVLFSSTKISLVRR